MHILLVDDDNEVRKTLGHVLERAGHQVDTAVDGVEGVSKFRNGHFDAVVSDYQMPRRNGLLMLADILMLAPGTVAVLMSGDPPERRLIEVATPAHASVHVLRKPFGTAELLALL